MVNNKRKERIKDIILLLLTAIVIFGVFILFSFWHLGFWRIKGYHYYSVDPHMEECNQIRAYHGEGDTIIINSSTNPKDCYSINGNKVTISVGDMACGNAIRITKLKVDRKMNVYIKAKGVPTAQTLQCGYCNPTATIYFFRKVNSVTLVNEDGTKLDKC